VRVAADLTLADVAETPAESWSALRRFGGPLPSEMEAMLESVDVLFPRGHELVVRTYEHLGRVPETAEILGWERGIDPEHLVERRRFFTVWLARTLSLDLGTDFAGYLHRAGQIHAGHGPRRVHTPPMWVTQSMGLVLGAFGEFLRDAQANAEQIARAMAGWNKYLMMQLALMHAGYEAARALDEGDLATGVRAYGRVRTVTRVPSLAVAVRSGGTLGDALRKVLNVVPDLREMMFERGWRDETPEKQEWPRVEPVFALRDGWRVLLRGRDARYAGGFDQKVGEGDEVDLFPPGR
jgi:molybdopterin converting factor small subunit